MAQSYEKAGVNLEAGYEVVRRIKKHVASTSRPGTMGNIGAFGGMFDLRMELRGVDSFCGVFKRSDRTVVGMGSHRHVLRDLRDEIGMGHEDGSPLFDPFEQPGIRVNV